MTTKILSGHIARKEIIDKLQKKIQSFSRTLRMDIILIGENPASEVYVETKMKLAQKLGVECFIHKFFDTVSEQEILKVMNALNKNSHVDGYIVQLPLPAHISLEKIVKTIDPLKDIDGFSYQNTGMLYHDVSPDQYLRPATGDAVIALLQAYNISVSGKNIVVIGKGFIVGKPIALMLLEEGATVTICHDATKNLSHFTKSADIIVSATGVKHLITSDMISKGTILIDVGFTKIGDTLFGDIDPNCIKKASYISPVPGGVGPLTVTMLLVNLVKAYTLSHNA